MKIFYSKHSVGYSLRLLFLGFISAASMFSLSVSAQLSTPAIIPIVSGLLLEEEEVICLPVSALTTITGNQNISNQQDLDSLANITKIVGTLLVSGSANLDLSPLRQLVEVTGSVSLDLSGVRSVRSFDCLKRAESSLVFALNTNLTYVSNFEKLEYVGGVLSFDGNPNLSSVPAFPMLHTVVGGLFLTQLGAASSIRSPGFPKLQSVGDPMWITDTNLNLVRGFDALTTIRGSLRIENNHSLLSISTLNALTTVESADPMGFESLSINFNQTLSSIDGFQLLNLQNITAIFVDSNPMLNCPIQLPNFTNVTSSAGNAVDCPTL